MKVGMDQVMLDLNPGIGAGLRDLSLNSKHDVTRVSTMMISAVTKITSLIGDQ